MFGSPTIQGPRGEKKKTKRLGKKVEAKDHPKGPEEHSLTQKVKIFQVLGMPDGSVGSQNRNCQVKYLCQVQMRR